MEDKIESPFLDTETSFIYCLRCMFMNGDLMSAENLHKATGVDLDLCIEFISAWIANYTIGDPPEI